MSDRVRIRYLPANEHGRDLVVGDLHGYLPDLDGALDELRFEPEVDRLISVGDLVDRGPDSMGCLRLLLEPWFHAVMGNHEDMMFDAVAALRRDEPESDPVGFHRQNGGGWLLNRWPPDAELEELLALAARLPHVLVVGEGEHRYNIVHAELPAMVKDEDIDGGMSRVYWPSLVWGRTIFGHPERSAPELVEGLSTTYCGHTICADEEGRPLRRASHVCLETGATLGMRLSIAVRHPNGREEVRQWETEPFSPGVRRRTR